jgi:2-oxoglutarate dehydrogenase complex dehydrogenase (E1) component-like enzyme
MSVIEQSPVYRPLYKFMKHHAKVWTGTATALLEELRKHATDLERIDLPTLNTKLSNAISEIAPNLRLASIMDVRKDRSKAGRSITITPMKNFANGSPDSSNG